MIGLIKGLPRKVNMAGSPQPIVTFTSNVKGLNIPEILAYITATQAGTGDPSPSNPRAISGVSSVDTTVCGVNIWDEQTEIGAYNNQGEKINYNVLRNKNVIMVKGLSSVYFYCGTTGVTARVVFYTDNMTCISSTPATTLNSVIAIPNNACYMSFNLDVNYGTTYNNDVSINYPATDTAYHAYTGTTATTALGGTYYGGYLNVTTGVLTVTYGMIKLSDIPKTKYGTYEAGARFITTFFDTISNTKLMGNSLLLNAIGKTLQTPYPTSGSWLHFSAGSSKTSFLIDQADVGEGVQLNIPNVNSWLDSINAYAVYELATPQTYQLTPAQLEQLLGQNNVFCSTGDVAVTQIWARRDRSIISRG